jgi:hypothetical protein
MKSVLTYSQLQIKQQPELNMSSQVRLVVGFYIKQLLTYVRLNSQIMAIQLQVSRPPIKDLQVYVR